MQCSARSLVFVALVMGVLALTPACDIQSLPSVNPGGETDSLTHYISVARHEDVFLGASQVDSIFETCTSLLTTVEGPCPDVACPAVMTRDGEVSTFDITSSVVTSERDLDELFEHSADIKVVSLMVGVCGVSDPDDTTVVLGCAYTNGSAVLSADAPPDVWAHEWGHVQGLPHRNDCEANLMHAYEVETNAVNSTERSAFLSASRASRAAREIPASDDSSAPFLASLRRQSGQTIEAWLSNLVDRSYLRGVPADALAAQSDPAVTATLAGMLEVETDPVRQRNILRLLGLHRDAAAVRALTAFLVSRPDELTADDLGVMAEAMMALGRLTAVDSTETALRWLIDGTEPQSWRDQGFTVDGRDAGEVLARMAVLALGLSEAPGALSWLEQLQASGAQARSVDDRFSVQVQQSLDRMSGHSALPSAGRPVQP